MFKVTRKSKDPIKKVVRSDGVVLYIRSADGVFDMLNDKCLLLRGSNFRVSPHAGENAFFIDIFKSGVSPNVVLPISDDWMEPFGWFDVKPAYERGNLKTYYIRTYIDYKDGSKLDVRQNSLRGIRKDELFLRTMVQPK